MKLVRNTAGAAILLIRAAMMERFFDQMSWAVALGGGKIIGQRPQAWTVAPNPPHSMPMPHRPSRFLMSPVVVRLSPPRIL
jgi:hypothetical protein